MRAKKQIPISHLFAGERQKLMKNFTLKTPDAREVLLDKDSLVIGYNHRQIDPSWLARREGSQDWERVGVLIGVDPAPKPQGWLVSTPLQSHVSCKVTLGTGAICLTSMLALPFTAFLAIAHPEGTHVPPSLIALPLGMLGVGLDRMSDGDSWKKALRFGSIILFLLLIGSTFLLYLERGSYRDGHWIGENPGQYAPQNFILFIFLPLVFLYSSRSEKVRRFASPLVWFGFIITMVFCCFFIGFGLSRLL